MSNSELSIDTDYTPNEVALVHGFLSILAVDPDIAYTCKFVPDSANTMAKGLAEIVVNWKRLGRDMHLEAESIVTPVQAN